MSTGLLNGVEHNGTDYRFNIKFDVISVSVALASRVENNMQWSKITDDVTKNGTIR
ncbi:MAG: hypothetical protein KDD59_09960 [Bdellovibrionales bacterium]|nr:hypothetical protein [Bdellovibrionales bacterium]